MLMAIRFGALRAGQLRTRVSAAPASEIANRFFGILLPLLDGTVRGENAAHGARVLMLRQSLYWRSVPRRKLPTGRASRTPHRGATPRQALGRRWASLALSVGRPSLLKWYRASRADQRVPPTKFPRPPASFSRLL